MDSIGINTKIPTLSPRLQGIIDEIPVSNRVLDIGTDHAYVPITLVLKGICKYVCATDKRLGPIQIAQKNIRKYKLEDRITTIKTDGLKEICVNEYDCVIITGMGGMEILSILSVAQTPPQQLVLQPQSSFRELRTYLALSGYQIVREVISKEQHRFYIIMNAMYTGTSVELTLSEAIIGSYILKNQSINRDKYLRYLAKQIEKQMRGNPELIEILPIIERMIVENETKSNHENP